MQVAFSRWISFSFTGSSKTRELGELFSCKVWTYFFTPASPAFLIY